MIVRDLTLGEVTEVLRESGVTWLGPTTRAYALCAAVDMRKGFDRLYGLATQTLGRDVLRGDLFPICRSRLSARQGAVLRWHGSVSSAQAAEQGALCGAVAGCTADGWSLSPSELALFLEGCALVGRRALSPPPLSPAELLVSAKRTRPVKTSD